MRENDLRIIANTEDYFHIQIFIPIGSIHEKKGQYGISHFLEHIKFNKSKKYDIDIMRNKNGKYLSNAYTTLDHTSYYLTSNENNIEKIINLINEIVFNTQFTKNEIEIERKIVLAEKIYRNQNEIVSNDISIYHDKNPYNRSVIGNVKDLKKITNRDLKKYNEQYINDFFVFVSCSKKNVNKVKKLCLKILPTSIKNDIVPLRNINLFNYELIIRDNIKEKTLLKFNFKTFNSTDTDYNYLDFFNYIISNNKESKLIKLLREQKGLIYKLDTSKATFLNNGFYILEIVLNTNTNVKNVIELILKELNKLKQEELNKTDFENYKQNYLNYLNLKFKNYQYFIEFYSNKLFLNPDFKIEPYLNNIKKIKSHKMLDVFNKILNFYQMNIVIYGNFKNINGTHKQIYNVIEKLRKV
jgi:predicted Zn-dependent peptidase